MTGIIVLNWNGWEDTIDCLKSLKRVTDSEYFIVLVDNGSNNNSVEKIEEYLREYEIDNYRSFSEDEFTNGQVNLDNISNKEILFYRLKDNYGFAKGNNKGLEIAKKVAADYYLLLNNDTEVEPDFLSKLCDFIKENPQYSVLTPKICYFFDKSLIWNCGGKLGWGFRKYYYAQQPEASIKQTCHIDIDFVTGCALFFKRELIDKDALLTERFFHGEEDFEFSYRMRKKGVKIACVLSSRIFHKVGRSTESLYQPGKTYAHYLNRFIDMRLHMSSPEYMAWVAVYLPYIILLLKKNGYSTRFLFKFLKSLIKEARTCDTVTQQRFLQLLNGDI